MVYGVSEKTCLNCLTTGWTLDFTRRACSFDKPLSSSVARLDEHRQDRAFFADADFVAQPACHAPGLRFNESKMLSERKNFDWVGSSFGRRCAQRVVFSLPRVVKTLR